MFRASSLIFFYPFLLDWCSQVLLMIKSPSASLANLTTFVKSLHPYEVCEIISLPIQQGNPDYLQFLMDATAGGKH